MTVARRLFFGSVWRSAEVFIAAAVQSVLLYLLGRWFSAHDMGLMMLCLTLLQLFQTVGDLGIGQGAAKYLAEYSVAQPWRLRPVTRSAVGIGGLLSALTSVLCLAFATFGARRAYGGEIVPLLQVAAVGLLFVSVSRVVTFLFFGLQGFKPLAIVVAVLDPMRLVFVALAYQWGAGPLGVMAALVAAMAVASGGMLGAFNLLYWRHLPPGRGQEWGNVFRYGLLTGLAGVAFFVWTRADLLLLGYYRSKPEVGQYGVALYLVKTFFLLVTVYVSVLAPSVAQAHAEGKRALMQELYEKSISVMLWAALPFALFLLFAAGPFVATVFPKQAGAEGAVRILSPIIVFQGVASVAGGGFLVSTGHARVALKNTLIGAAVALGLDLLLIPRYGVTGAALATSVSNALVTVMSQIVALRSLRLRFVLHAAETLVASAAMVVVLAAVAYALREHTALRLAALCVSAPVVLGLTTLIVSSVRRTAPFNLLNSLRGLFAQG